MDVRSNNEWNSKRVEVRDNPVPKVVYKTIRLVLLRNTNLKIRGSVTGKEYFFRGAGSEVDVDERDAPKMLERKRNNSCCSGMLGQPYFGLGG
jgi:hypothetical protein